MQMFHKITMTALLGGVAPLFLLVMFSDAQTTDSGLGNATNASILSESTENLFLVTTVAALSLANTQSYPESPLDDNSDLSGCSCNLIANRCEANCCCDSDCDAIDLLTFTTCKDLRTFNEGDRSCARTSMTDNPLTDENETSTVSANNPSIFCIWIDNYNSRNYYNIPSLAKTDGQFQSLIQSATSQLSYRTPAFNPTTGPLADRYSTGQFVYYDNNKVVSLPGSLSSSSDCVDFNPIQFLYDRSATCNRALYTELSRACESAKLPELSPEMVRGKLQSAQIRTVPVPNGNTDPPISVNVVGAKTTFYNASTCFNVLTQMDVEVTHDAGVILSIDILLSSSHLSGSLKNVRQGYSVKFSELNATTPTFTRSGNPGYLVGHPVIAGKINSSIILLDSDRSKYLTVIRPSPDGTCLTDSDSRISVNFGENIRSGCLFRLTEVGTTNCEQLRDASRLALLGPTSNIDANGNTDIYIASFGNSDNTRVGDWVPLLSGPFPPQGCSISMHLQILYAFVGAVQDPQARIIGARLKFSENSLVFQKGQDETQQFSIVSSVSFIEVSSAPEPALANPPVSSLRIPANFFHPYYHSSAQLCDLNTMLVPVIVGLALLIYI